jgi:hypothetical protein
VNVIDRCTQSLVVREVKVSPVFVFADLPRLPVGLVAEEHASLP